MDVQSDDNNEESNLQKANIYNEYSPFHELIKEHATILFNEIQENLSRTIQLSEFEPGFSIWSNKFKEFLSLYGFHFTKMNHIKLIHFYISILSIPHLNYLHAQICFDILYELLRYIPISFLLCVRRCSPYFSATATQEILDELRPKLCPIEWGFCDAMRMFELFLPVNLPPDLHDQGFKLWLPEFFHMWENIYNKSGWELRVTDIFSSLAWNNIGYINWENWLPQIFTRILRGFSLPIGKMQMSSQKYSYIVSDSAKWIVAMIGNESLCLQYLKDLFFSMKTFYHPSNTGEFQENLLHFILKLAEHFVERVHLERKVDSVWYFIPLESHRLTDQDITDFVNCVKEYAFISIFNKDHVEEAAKACQYLSILRPELIVPAIVQKHFSSIESINEPHRFTSIVKCLTCIVRQIVRQTSSYCQGQMYVLPLLLSVLPGIDLNDLKKMSVTLEFLDTILLVISCIDCSSAINNRNDLTEIEKEVCLLTKQFEDFIIEFLNRIFKMINILSTDISDALIIDTDINTIDNTIKSKLTSIIFNIVQHSSNKIFQIVRDKIINYITGECLSPKVRDIISSLVQGLIKGNPIETLKYLLPKTCQSIENILNDSQSNLFLIDDKDNIELISYLTLFSDLVRARGDTLIIYKNEIIQIFNQSIHIINKNSYETIANAAKNLLESLTHIYPIHSRLTTQNIDESFNDYLPIRSWGQSTDFDKLQVQFHIPNEEEMDFACEFINKFLYSELTLLNNKILKLSNNQRLRSLTIIQFIAIGCFTMIPRIETKQIDQLIPSVVPHDSKYRIQNLIYSKQLKLKENLRMRLFIDIGKLLDILIENHSDDIYSIITALKFYPLISIYCGIFKDVVDDLHKNFISREKILKNKLCNQGQNIRFLTINKMALQIQEFQLNNFGILTDIDKEIILKLFKLSMNRYSEIRRQAQNDLLCLLKSYRFSFQIILHQIIQLLNKSDEDNHDQIKGCLYILLGNNSFFLPTQYSWEMKEKLWLSIAQMAPTNKSTIQHLIENITKKIYKTFVMEVIIQNTNEISIQAAALLWHPLETNEMKRREEYNKNDIESYNNLMERLCSFIKNDTSITWRQQKTTISLLCLLLQKNVPIRSSCIQIFVDLLLHDNIQLRKCAEKIIGAICRLQKPPRIYVEKCLEEIVENENKPLPIITNDAYYPGDRDDNFWLTFNDYKPPQTQIQWEQTCFLDKSFYGYFSWPKIFKYSLNKRIRYTINNMPDDVAILYNRFIDKNFIKQIIQLMILDEDKDEMDFDQIRFSMFKGLFRNFGLAFFDNFMEELYILMRERKKEKQEESHRIAAEIVAGMIRGSKHWTLEMLDEFWTKLIPFLNELFLNINFETINYWNKSFKYSMENRDPRRMYRLIDFISKLIDNKIILSTFTEIARWSLIQNLSCFQWRIPSIWSHINQHAKLLIDHSHKGVRQQIINVLSISLSFDITLFNGKSTRQPNVDQFIDFICQRLQKTIETYEKTPLNPVIEIDSETRQALNFIESVVEIHSQFFSWSKQPIKNGIIRLFAYLCEIENIPTNDDTFKENLTTSRLYTAISYLNTEYLETLIQQLIQVSTSSKWHARQSAIEFIQNMIFSNLFNARPYAKQFHEIVLKCLFDEQLEVRIAASLTLSGFYQCGYIQVTQEYLKYFREMSKTIYFTKINGKKVILQKNIVKRHGGILGVCAIVSSSPYDIPIYVPDALMILCEHSHDPDLIRKSIKKCLSEFRRTHHDSWHEHRQQFTEDQLAILADVLISHSYYA
ncbi:unnamed protein product [Adineta steineri]|uniref:Uncharacterized protein n=1 Tax=Adineta steineri TaxID=433720 RepID=A0A814K9U4_9BILA|nr:unnamed protein product [Adineta steineri]